MLSDQQFDRMQRLALSLAGIALLERHHELLVRRCQRLGILGTAIDALLSAAEKGEKSATQQLLSLLTTKFTGFFRHPRHFDLAAAHALRIAQVHRTARLWSAGAATGEEPWSLAMALIEFFQRDDPPVSILATDVEETALEVAQRGEYREARLQSLNLSRRERFFSKAKAPGCWVVAPALRRLVEFRPLNLADVAWRVNGPLDVILCRNVLLYFEIGHRYAVLEKMASLLAPNGLLLLDPTEHLGTAGHWFTLEADGVYSRRRVAAAPSRVNARMNFKL